MENLPNQGSRAKIWARFFPGLAAPPAPSPRPKAEVNSVDGAGGDERPGEPFDPRF